MKKLLSILFVVTMLVSMLAISSTATNAESSTSAIHTSNLQVKAGDVVEYKFNVNINTSEKRLINVQAATTYSDNLQLIYKYDEYRDIDTTEMFPIIKGAVNNSVESKHQILYNYSNISGKRFNTDNSTLICLKFLATKTGNAEVITDINELSVGYPEEDFDEAITDSTVLLPQYYSPNHSLAKSSSKVVIFGDANTDGVVNLKDASAIQKYLVGFSLPVFNTTAANVNNNVYYKEGDESAISIKDVTYIQQSVAMVPNANKCLVGKYTYTD